MSDSQHANGDTPPRGLRNALAIVKASVKKAVKLRRKGYARAPRAICTVCGRAWDHAIVPPNSLPEASFCSECRGLLAQGYTALVTSNPDAYAFVKSPDLAEGLAGAVITLTPENFAQIKQKFNEGKTQPNPET